MRLPVAGESVHPALRAEVEHIVCSRLLPHEVVLAKRTAERPASRLVKSIPENIISVYNITAQFMIEISKRPLRVPTRSTCPRVDSEDSTLGVCIERNPILDEWWTSPRERVRGIRRSPHHLTCRSINRNCFLTGHIAVNDQIFPYCYISDSPICVSSAVCVTPPLLSCSRVYCNDYSGRENHVSDVVNVKSNEQISFGRERQASYPYGFPFFVLKSVRPHDTTIIVIVCKNCSIRPNISPGRSNIYSFVIYCCLT